MISNESLSELRIMLNDLKKQKKHYQPTTFWKKASVVLIKEFEERGFESFRSEGSPQDFFVPTYGAPGNSLTKDFTKKIEDLAVVEYGKNSKAYLTLMRELNGEAWAHADYRTFLAGDVTDVPPNLRAASESKVGNPKEHFNFEGKYYSRSFLNYLQGLVFLKRNVPTHGIKRVIEIGGGFGSLGEILQQTGDYAYVDIDIPPTSAVAHYYLANLSTHEVIPYSQTRNLDRIDFPNTGQSMILCPWQLPRLTGNVDLAVNFISFQEMEPDVVKNYLEEIDRLEATYILLRNLREGKRTISQGAEFGVISPVEGSDYDQFLQNYNLLETNVMPFGYATIDGFNSELRLYQRK